MSPTVASSSPRVTSPSVTIPLADLRAQHEEMRADLDRAIASIVDSSAFVGGLNNVTVQQFEQAFARYLGAEHCVTCANGTDAIELVLRAMDIGSGDEVIVPALSWISTAEAVSNMGAVPVFVDVLANAPVIDPAQIEAACTAATKALIVVHLYGLPAQMDAILAIAKRRNLKVIEDCAQAHGAKYRGRTVGTIGDAATFSFFPSKNLGAIGDGGAVVARDAAIADTVRLLANHGQRRRNDHLCIGRNSRLDGLQAAVLSAKLPRLESWNERRRRNAERMRAGLAGLKELALPAAAIDSDSEHVYHLFVVRTPRRDALAEFLRSRGITTAVHYPVPLPLTAPYRNAHRARGGCPNASATCAEILSLPIYPELTDAQLNAIVAAIHEFFASDTA